MNNVQFQCFSNSSSENCTDSIEIGDSTFICGSKFHNCSFVQAEPG